MFSREARFSSSAERIRGKGTARSLDWLSSEHPYKYHDTVLSRARVQYSIPITNLASTFHIMETVQR